MLNGWEIASIITIQSGTPFSVLTNATPFIQARADLTPFAPNCNLNLSGSIASRLNDYFNLACFIPATAANDFGTTGRNIILGPGQKNMDLSAVKFFPLERSAVEFRMEFFNAFNHANFANPVNVLANADVGEIVTTTTGSRVIQVVLKLNF